MYNVYVYPGLDHQKQTAYRRKSFISRKLLTYDQIISIVADFYNLSEADILGKSRLHNVVKARTCTQALIKELLEYSYVEIGKVFKSSNHTTPLHNVKKSNNWLKVYPAYAKEYNLIKQYCKTLQEQYEQASTII